MAKEEHKTIKDEAVVPYELAVGSTWSKFFDGLKEEKILGTKCKECGRVFVPARTFCPRCFVDTDEWVEVGQEGAIENWVLVNYRYYGQMLKVPFIATQIRLDGSGTGFVHQIGGFDLSNLDTVRERVKIRGRVKAVWSKEKHGDIFDIAYFELME